MSKIYMLFQGFVSATELVILFSIQVRQKILVSQHLHDASKQVVVAETDNVVFEADALKHFLIHKPLDLSR